MHARMHENRVFLSASDAAIRVCQLLYTWDYFEDLYIYTNARTRTLLLIDLLVTKLQLYVSLEIPQATIACLSTQT